MTLGERILYNAEQGIETEIYTRGSATHSPELIIQSIVRDAAKLGISSTFDSKMLRASRRGGIDEILEDELYKHSIRLNNYRTNQQSTEANNGRSTV